MSGEAESVLKGALAWAASLDLAPDGWALVWAASAHPVSRRWFAGAWKKGAAQVALVAAHAPAATPLEVLALRSTYAAVSSASQVVEPQHLLAACLRCPVLGPHLAAADMDLLALVRVAMHPNVALEPQPATAAETLVDLVLHNDDLTPQLLVIRLLVDHLGMEEPEAIQAMLSVHHDGRAVLGRMSVEEAQWRAEALMDHAALHGAPLLATWELVPSTPTVGA